MYIVKVGDKFVSEGYPYNSLDRGLSLVNDFTKATKYNDMLEFLLALKYTESGRDSNFPREWGEYVPPTKTFTLIDTETMTQSEHSFSYKPEINQNLKVTKKEFKLLLECFYGSSNWTYIDDEWVAFPSKEEYSKINKLRYYTRGLTDIFENVFKYRNASIPGCYRFYNGRMSLLKNDDLKNIALSDIDQCTEFVITV